MEKKSKCWAVSFGLPLISSWERVFALWASVNERSGAWVKRLRSMPRRSEEHEARYRTLSDLVKNRQLPRSEVRWPVIIITENGPVAGEARNITVEGVFVHCAERLR